MRLLPFPGERITSTWREVLKFVIFFLSSLKRRKWFFSLGLNFKNGKLTLSQVNVLSLTVEASLLGSVLPPKTYSQAESEAICKAFML